MLETNSLRNFKKSRCNTDKELYKKAISDVSKLIATKKRVFFEEKLLETIGKPKELWESLKFLGMPKKQSLISMQLNIAIH